MERRLSHEEKMAVARKLSDSDRPLQKIIDWQKNPDEPPESVKDMIRAMRSPAMLEARKKSLEALRKRSQ
jgi:hypothetical protein